MRKLAIIFILSAILTLPSVARASLATFAAVTKANDDYSKASTIVGQLKAGDVKTNLQTRLAYVKVSIDISNLELIVNGKKLSDTEALDTPDEIMKLYGDQTLKSTPNYTAVNTAANALSIQVKTNNVLSDSTTLTARKAALVAKLVTTGTGVGDLIKAVPVINNCPAIPVNSTRGANSPALYTVHYGGAGTWLPAAPTVDIPNPLAANISYLNTATTTPCRFYCDLNYHYDAATCSDGTTKTKTACETSYSCSDPSYLSQSSCLNAGVCSNSAYATQALCIAAGTCSDSTITGKETCEAGGRTVSEGYCEGDESISDPVECDNTPSLQWNFRDVLIPSTIWTSSNYTWTPTPKVWSNNTYNAYGACILNVCGGTSPSTTVGTITKGPENYTVGYTPTVWTYDGAATTSTQCKWKCDAGYHQDGSSCVSDTCGGTAPTTTTGTTKGTGLHSVGSLSWNYDATAAASNALCKWKCDSPFIQSGNSCVCPSDQHLSGSTCVSNSQTVSCVSQPAHSTAHGSSFTQTYVSNAWTPASKAWTVAASGECSFTCTSPYTSSGLICHQYVSATCTRQVNPHSCYIIFTCYDSESYNCSYWDPS